MPELQDIEEFKNEFARLGNEPQIRAEKGEVMPEITPPEASSTDDLSDLFDDTSLSDDGGDDILEQMFGDELSEPPAEPEEDLIQGADEEIQEAREGFEEIVDSDELSDDFGIPEGLLDGLDESLDESESEDDDFGFELDLEPEELTAPEVEAADAEDEFDIDFDTAADSDTGTEASADDEADIFADFDDAMDDFGVPEGLTDGLEEDLAGEPEEDFEVDFEESMDGLDSLDIDDSADASEAEDDLLSDFLDEPDFDDTDEDITDFNDLGDESAADPVDSEVDFDMSFDDEKLSTDEEAVEDFGEEEDASSDFDTDFSMPDDFSGEEESLSFDDTDFTFEDEEPEQPDFNMEDDSFGTDSFEDSFEDEADDGESEFSIDTEEESSDEFSLEDFSMGEIDDDDIEASEFSLGDLGGEFGLDDGDDTDYGVLENIPMEDQDESAAGYKDLSGDDNYAIPDDEFDVIKKTLITLPRNLKIIIEELIGEKRLAGENLEKLLKGLKSGAAPKELGSIVSKITGKKVQIPTQYERKTAEDFESERGTFLYAFKRNFIPMFRTAMLAAAALGLILFLGFKFLYTPLHAESLYKTGYEEIQAGNYVQANNYFNRGFNEWKKKSWFFKYAEEFINQKQYLLAEEKYESLLAWYPDERQGRLDYADLEFRILGKYPEAETLLKQLLADDLSDYDARLMLGDTYMEWAQELNPVLYDEARFNYAKLLEQYGHRDVLLFRMLRYFIRTDNYQEAMVLYNAFKDNPKAKIEPSIYAELAGYFIDKGQLGDVRDILFTARALDESIPEIHYNLARYFEILDIPEEEDKALSAAIWLFENTSPLTSTRTGMLVDSYNRYGTVLYDREMYLDAEEYFQKALTNYEDALARDQLKPEAKYGSIYSNLGDLAYYISGDFDSALKFFQEAEDNLFTNRDLKYKKGYVYYYNEDYRKALIEFYDTAEGFSVDKDLMYATANTLFNRNDFYLAEGMYMHLLDILNKEYSAISYLLIDEIPEHRALVENLMKVSNNLGVTKYRLYEKTRDPKKNAEAMVLLTDSTEYYDSLARDPNSLEKPNTVNLSYLNSKAVFYPVEDYRLQIYGSIPRDMTKLNF